MTGLLKGWYVRELLEELAKAHGSFANVRLRERLGATSRAQFDQLLRAGEAADARSADGVPIDSAEELLLTLDTIFGDGSGRVLEALAAQQSSRTLARAGGVLVPGDLAGTMQRLHVLVERPWGGVALVYELFRTPAGFELTLAIEGRPRATRLLRHLTAGLVRAAHRYARDVRSDELRIAGEDSGSRSRLLVSLRSETLLSPTLATGDVPARRRSNGAMRAVTQPSLSAEVERIMSRTRVDTPAAPHRVRRPSIPPGAANSSVPPSPRAQRPTAPSPVSSGPSSVPPPRPSRPPPPPSLPAIGEEELSPLSLRPPRIPREE